MMTLHVCENCGKTDYNLSRFRKHGPCNPESKTVWVSWGSGGRRRPNSPEFIEAEVKRLFAEHQRVDSVSVHDGRCNLGRTSPGGCDCEPVTVLRPRA